jgi:protein-S-isoprenylcysteine O-methyltransferase Ste14
MTFVTWALAGHYRSAPDGSWSLNAGLEPEYLLTTGPYRFTRNPMYVGAILIWTGWAVLLGSDRVAVGAAVVTTGVQGAVAWEERQLVGRFGDEWRQFAAQTPRWLGRGSALTTASSGSGP